VTGLGKATADTGPADSIGLAPNQPKCLGNMSNMQHELMRCISTENKRVVISHINSRITPEAVVHEHLRNLMALTLITYAATPPANICARNDRRAVDSDVAGSIAKALIRLQKERLILSMMNDCEFRTAKFRNLMTLLRLTNR
jgi:hypothetical protein